MRVLKIKLIRVMLLNVTILLYYIPKRRNVLDNFSMNTRVILVVEKR